MKTGILLAATSRVLRAGLLVLASALPGANFSAQAQQTCPVPADLTSRDPEVTAQDVENDNTHLEAFALELRAQLKRQSQEITSLGRVSCYGYLVRQESGPWRSGSTYPKLAIFAAWNFYHVARFFCRPISTWHYIPLNSVSL